MAFIYEFVINLGIFLLVAIGLMIIYGVMGIINMAQGEFIMLGAYVSSYVVARGHIPFVVGVLAAFLAAAAFGAVVERLIIRRLYGDIIMGLVATWGLSLFISGSVLLLLGPSGAAVQMPVGSHVSVGRETYGVYPLLICGVATLILLGLNQLLQRSQWGVELRATIYNRNMAAALGVRTDLINVSGFALGTGLAGVAGAFLAPLSALTPTMGATYLPTAFITVVVAGSSHIVGSLLMAGVVLALAFTIGIHNSNGLIGLFCMFGTALVIIPFAPNGLSDKMNELQSVLKGALRRS